jgi:hypothetical protein
MKKSGKCQTKRDRPVYSRIATTSHARRKPIGPMARIQGISKSPSCISAWFMENDDSKKRGPNASRLSIATIIPAARLPKIQPCLNESDFVLTRVHFPFRILRNRSSGQNPSEFSKNLTMRVGLVVCCYIDVFYPEVGITALELLEKLGVEVEYPSRLLQHLPQMQPFLHV